jgi:hypothetical protein
MVSFKVAGVERTPPCVKGLKECVRAHPRFDDLALQKKLAQIALSVGVDGRILRRRMFCQGSSGIGGKVVFPTPPFIVRNASTGTVKTPNR